MLKYKKKLIFIFSIPIIITAMLYTVKSDLATQWLIHKSKQKGISKSEKLKFLRYAMFIDPSNPIIKEYYFLGTLSEHPSKGQSNELILKRKRLIRQLIDIYANANIQTIEKFNDFRLISIFKISKNKHEKELQDYLKSKKKSSVIKEKLDDARSISFYSNNLRVPSFFSKTRNLKLKQSYATNRKPSTRSKSIFSRRNFVRICVSGESTRN